MSLQRPRPSAARDATSSAASTASRSPFLPSPRRDGVQIVGISRQWTVGSGPRPYRYGGAVGPVELPPAIDAAMRTAVERVCAALGLVGLVAFDFLLAGDTPHLLEVNPRPSATLDVFDDAERGAI